MKGRYIALVAMTGISLAVNAEIVWDWSFASESGQFVTEGSIASPGEYELLDFSVTASATGGSIGSLLGGDYLTGTLSTPEPFSFTWDGSQVTQWQHSGSNTFDWWAFEDSADYTQLYFFGWDTGSINDPASAALYDLNLGSNSPRAVGDVTVSPIPEPASLCLIALISGGLGFTRRFFPAV